jgi:hypothetical protein
MKKMRLGLATVVALAIGTACSAPPPKPAVRENLVQRTSTVLAIDHAMREVTLRDEDGAVHTIVVSENVRNLPQVKAGDKVVVSYYEAIAAEVKKPGEGVQGVEAEVATARADEGKMPAGGAGVLLRTTVTIDSVDRQMNTVTFMNSEGELRTVAVESPQGREFIKGLKKGDQVEVAYTEALAIEVKPAD